MNKQVFQSVSIAPDHVLAGETTEFIITLTVGDGYTEGPSRLVFDFPATIGMSRPTLMHFEDFGFVEVYLNNPHVEYQMNIWDLEVTDFVVKGGKRSWRDTAARMAVLDLDGGLQPGDVIELHWGETGGGFGPGTHVTHVVPRADYESTVHVRYFANQEEGLPDFGRDFTGYERPRPDHVEALSFAIRPCDPHRLRVIRQPERTLLIAQDLFWNIAEVDDPASVVQSRANATRLDTGVFAYPGNDVQVSSRGLPMFTTPRMDDVYDGYNLYWGDVHNHSAISVDCIEREKMDMYPADLMRFARDRAGLDFYATSDHHEPHHHPRNHVRQNEWEALLEAVQQYHQPGEFVVFPAFEFRCPRGDTAVLLNWMAEYNEIFHPEWSDIRDLWQEYEGKDYLTIPHFHNPGSLEDGEWWTVGEQHEPVLEIFSCHGSYERPDALERKISLIKSRRPDRFGSWFLQNNYRYGFVGNSDGHKGHVGTNGVTAVFAKSLDRASILEAYRQRRVYGTTNARLRLIFTANGHLMGSVVPNTSTKTLMIDATGENRLKKIDVFRNAEHYSRLVPDGISFKSELTIEEDEPSFWYVRVTQVDNHVAFSSPIWFE